MLSVPKQLVPMLEELSNLYAKDRKDAVVAGLCSLVAHLTGGISPIDDKKTSSSARIEENLHDESYVTFLKSWQEILDVQVYVDTDIYGTLNLDEDLLEGEFKEELNCESEPQVVSKANYQPDRDLEDKDWPEVEKSIGLPPDLFTRSWTTPELSKILGCSANILRKAKKQNRLPVKIDDLLIDCVDPDSKKILWRVRSDS
jgi:hypothetical protein